MGDGQLSKAVEDIGKIWFWQSFGISPQKIRYCINPFHLGISKISTRAFKIQHMVLSLLLVPPELQPPVIFLNPISNVRGNSCGTQLRSSSWGWGLYLLFAVS